MTRLTLAVAIVLIAIVWTGASGEQQGDRKASAEAAPLPGKVETVPAASPTLPLGSTAIGREPSFPGLLDWSLPSPVDWQGSRGAPSGATASGSVRASSIVGAVAGVAQWAEHRYAGSAESEVAGSKPVPGGPDGLAAPTSIRGTASWYCHDGRFRGAPRSRCTRGVPASTMAVAVPWKLRSQFPRGTRVRLCRASRCVSATVRDVNVGPSWDCYAVVFNKLAPLSVGRITVTVRAVP